MGHHEFGLQAKHLKKGQDEKLDSQVLHAVGRTVYL